MQEFKTWSWNAKLGNKRTFSLFPHTLFLSLLSIVKEEIKTRLWRILTPSMCLGLKHPCPPRPLLSGRFTEAWLSTHGNSSEASVLNRTFSQKDRKLLILWRIRVIDNDNKRFYVNFELYLFFGEIFFYSENCSEKKQRVNCDGFFLPLRRFDLEAIRRTTSAWWPFFSHKIFRSTNAKIGLN